MDPNLASNDEVAVPITAPRDEEAAGADNEKPTSALATQLDDQFLPDGTEDDEDGQETPGRCGKFCVNTAYPLPAGDVTCCLPKHGLIRSPLDPFKVLWGWLVINRTQILSGITVSLAQVPEAVSFSFVAGVDPIVGLQSAWIHGLCTSLAGGRPGMVSGATGAVAVVLTGLVRDHGLGYLFYAIMLAGVLQIIFGLFKLGVLVRMIPHPVMVGFCNGLGVVIGVAQFNIFKVPESQLEAAGYTTSSHGDDGHRDLNDIGMAFSAFTNGRPWVDPVMGGWMTFLIVVTLATYILFPKCTTAIPGSLAGIIVATIVEWALIRPIGYRTNTVADLASVAGSFPVPVWVDTTYGYKDIMPPLNSNTLKVIFPTAITAGAIGLLESLLTLELIDELTNTKGSGNREALGQGLGNLLSGMFGGMGGCTTIGQSLMNIHSGGYTRLSSSVAAFFMLFILLVAYPLINLIPVAGLAGVMFVVTFFTIEWSSGWTVLAAAFPEKYRQKFGMYCKVKRSDVIIMLIVVAVTLIFDLAIAVAVGVLVAALVFAWDAGTRLQFDRAVSEDGESVVYEIRGPIFFAAVKPLLDLFPDPADEPKDVTILLEGAEVYDWSAMVALKALHERFERNGATVKFRSLTVASHKLMMKSADLWEGVNVFEEEDLNVEEDELITTHLHVEDRKG